MKAFYRVLFSVFILLPCLILGYQNCSELSSKDLLANQNSAVESNSFRQKPVFLNDLSLLGYSKTSPCSSARIDPIKLYDKAKNICTEANDSCEAHYLIKEGYQEDQSEACKDIAHPGDDTFKNSLKRADAVSSGFKAKPDQICTMQFTEMINFKTRECASASNGCQIAFFSSLGFIQDKFGICR